MVAVHLDNKTVQLCPEDLTAFPQIDPKAQGGYALPTCDMSCPGPLTIDSRGRTVNLGNQGSNLGGQKARSGLERLHPSDATRNAST